MLKDMLSGQRDTIVRSIVSKLGVDAGQASGFVDKAVAMIEKLVKSGDLDVKKLAAGDMGALTSKLDLGSLGSLLGGGETEARQGLASIMGPLQEKLSGGGAGDLLGKIPGAKGALGGLGGKMFGR